MKKLLLLFLLFLTTSTLFCQKVTWFETTQANIGLKQETETEYHWNEPTYPRIRIAVEEHRVVVYAEHLYIINVNGTYSEQPNFTVFYGKDDEGIQCHVELGYSPKANQAYFMIKYSDLALFYYVVPV